MCERNWKKKISIVSKKGEVWIFIRLEKKNNEAGYDKSVIPRILLLTREEKELMSIFFYKKKFFRHVIRNVPTYFLMKIDKSIVIIDC